MNSNDFCVVSSDHVTKGNFVKGKNVDVLYDATVVYTSSSKDSSYMVSLLFFENAVLIFSAMLSLPRKQGKGR